MGMLALSLLAAPAFAQKSEHQAEIVKAADAALAKFYKAQPVLKTDVERAPGYAVFTTYGLSFIVGGRGGKGLVHDNTTNRNVFMSMGEASVGAQVGVAQNDELIVFKDKPAMQRFIDEGWNAAAGASMAAGAKGDTVGGGVGSGLLGNATIYTLTPNGVQARLALSGAKYWRDDELN